MSDGMGWGQAGERAAARETKDPEEGTSTRCIDVGIIPLTPHANANPLPAPFLAVTYRYCIVNESDYRGAFQAL